MSELIPPRYKCRRHDTDLTDAVRAKVDAGDVIVVGGFGWRPRRGGDPRETTFRVRVMCPGTDDDGHELEIRGLSRS